MNIKLLSQLFSVCKLSSCSDFDYGEPYCFLGVTDEEISLVCPTQKVPADTLAREDDWRGFRVQGVLDFSLVGILAQISSLLAEQGISIFAVSTYNTDYIFVKSNVFNRTISVLQNAGYSVEK